MVVARRGDGSRLDARGPALDHHIVDDMPVVILHVLHEGATAQHVDHVQSAADGKRGYAVLEAIGRQR